MVKYLAAGRPKLTCLLSLPLLFAGSVALAQPAPDPAPPPVPSAAPVPAAPVPPASPEPPKEGPAQSLPAVIATPAAATPTQAELQNKI